MKNRNANVLLQEALFLFELGIPVFLSDPVTTSGICGTSEFKPITDREHLEYLCNQYPASNLEVALDEERGLIALAVGVGSWAQSGEESFRDLTEIYGVPETISYRLPDGATYYLFKPGPERPKIVTGPGVLFFNGVDSFPAFPSVVDGQQVEKLGTATTVQNLLDWLAGNGHTETSAESEISQPPPEGAETFPPERQNVTKDFTKEATEIPPREEAVTVMEPITALRKVVTELVASKKESSALLAHALEWNRTHGSPVKVDEIANLVEELGEITTSEAETLAGEELLFNLAEGTILFHDDLTEPYFFFEGEAFKAPSRDYEAQLQYRYYKKTGDMPKSKQLKNVLNILKSKARFEGQRVTLKNRVSEKDGALLYDLRDKRYLKTTANGWEIVPAFPLFRRYQHQQPQVEPVSGGNPWDVFDFLTVIEENRLLVMVYIVSLFVPRIAHPVLAVFGDQGSAKSFFCTVINRLVDPTLTDRVIQPKNERDLIQTLRQKYVTVQDNTSRIDNRVSDIICQACTGAAISYRQLYTDEGENIAQFRHVVILNSINLAIVNPDLMDRSIILRFHRIDPQDRKPEDELWDAFEIARPGILGGIFDTLAKAIAIYPSIKVEHLPRLADFAKWGYAIAEALGRSGAQFLEDFTQNIKRQNQSVAEKNVLCQSVLELMATKETFLKSVRDAHNALKNIAREDAKDATFPKLPHHLREGLERLKSTLEEHNITFQFFDRTKTGVNVLFTKTASPASSSQENTSPVSPEAFCGVPGVADDAGEAETEIPIVNFDELPEVVNV